MQIPPVLYRQVRVTNTAFYFPFSYSYDFIHLHKVYNHTYLNITKTQWQRVVELGDWIESNKYSKATIGSIGGGILANEIAANFQQTVASKRKAKVRLRSRLLFERKGAHNLIL